MREAKYKELEFNTFPEFMKQRMFAFNILDYVINSIQKETDTGIIEEYSEDKKFRKFEALCRRVKETLTENDVNEINESETITRQKNALLGFPTEVKYYKKKIEDILVEEGEMNSWYPRWYGSIVDAVFNETIGFSGITNWLTEDKYKSSMACEVIGDRVFYEIDGKYVIQPQRIKKDRRDQLVNNLLLADMKEAQSQAWHEIYTAVEHLRVTIYKANGITKKDQEVILFRRYTVKNLSFEEHANRGTIPHEAIPLFEKMVKLGPNVVFCGPVASGKTTMMQTYKIEESKTPMQTLSIETDDECQWHEILPPNYPILQFVPSEKEEDNVIVRAKRSDAQAVIIGEARHGKYMKFAVDAANMGTRRMLTTVHFSNILDFPYDMADKIVSDFGGDIVTSMIKISKTFNYIWVMGSLPEDRGKKRLLGVWEMYFEPEKLGIHLHQIMKYVPASDGSKEHFEFDDFVSKGLEKDFLFESESEYKEFRTILKELKGKSPIKGQTDFICPYVDIFLKGKMTV